MNGMGMASQGI